MTENFDLASWQQQGLEALDKLVKEYAETQVTLDTLGTKIEEMKAVLGVSEDKPKRVRIRPLILEQVRQAKGKRVSVDDVVQAIQADVGGLATEAIATAIARAVKDVEELDLNDKGLAYVVQKVDKTD